MPPRSFFLIGFLSFLFRVGRRGYRHYVCQVFFFPVPEDLNNFLASIYVLLRCFVGILAITEYKTPSKESKEPCSLVSTRSLLRPY